MKPRSIIPYPPRELKVVWELQEVKSYRLHKVISKDEDVSQKEDLISATCNAHAHCCGAGEVCCGACEVSACSVLTDVNVPRGCALIRPNTARLGRQIRCVCASPAWLEAQQDPASTAQVGAAWWPLWLDSWRVIELPVTLKASARDGTTPSLPHMRHIVGNRRTRPDRRSAETGSET